MKRIIALLLSGLALFAAAWGGVAGPPPPPDWLPPRFLFRLPGLGPIRYVNASLATGDGSRSWVW